MQKKLKVTRLGTESGLFEETAKYNILREYIKIGNFLLNKAR